MAFRSSRGLLSLLLFAFVAASARADGDDAGKFEPSQKPKTGVLETIFTEPKHGGTFQLGAAAGDITLGAVLIRAAKKGLLVVDPRNELIENARADRIRAENKVTSKEKFNEAIREKEALIDEKGKPFVGLKLPPKVKVEISKLKLEIETMKASPHQFIVEEVKNGDQVIKSASQVRDEAIKAAQQEIETLTKSVGEKPLQITMKGRVVKSVKLVATLGTLALIVEDFYGRFYAYDVLDANPGGLPVLDITAEQLKRGAEFLGRHQKTGERKGAAADNGPAVVRGAEVYDESGGDPSETDLDGSTRHQ